MIKYEFEPGRSECELIHVGTYKRRVPVSLNRMYENALDWAHLPYVHSGSFKSIRPIEFGAWGWRADVLDIKDRNLRLELLLDRSSRRWITRNLEGVSQGAEIWTHVFEVGERSLDLVIDFFVPAVSPNDRGKVGLAYAASYERLYDEDVEMMGDRQFQLDKKVETNDQQDEIILSLAEEKLPFAIRLSGREYLVNRDNANWYVYPARCPHLLGPLHNVPIKNRAITCPWHGFEFDLLSGKQRQKENSRNSCELGPMPRVEAIEGKVRIYWA